MTSIGVLGYLHTISGLRATQLIHLVADRTRRRGQPLQVRDGRIDPGVLIRFGVHLMAAVPSDIEMRKHRADRLVAGHLSLLGVELPLSEIAWAGPIRDPLFEYHVHYLDWCLDLLWAHRASGLPAYLTTFEAVLGAWATGTRGRVTRAWEPYPAATRALSFAHALELLPANYAGPARDLMARDLAAYAAAAERLLERHLQANHLWRDVAAWVVATRLLAGEEWAGSRLRAESWWERLLAEQVLADGTHEERSPLYHAIVLKDLALVAAVLPDGSCRDRTLQVGSRMARVLDLLWRANGTPHLFNDSAARDDLDVGQLRGLLRSVGCMATAPRGPFLLSDAGYAGVVFPDTGERLVIDCGRPGPRHQPGHAHCQLLAFEYDVDGLPLMNNAGVRGYEGDPWRGHFRGTSAHNTAQIGYEEQSEIWGTFRMGRRARLRGCEVVEGEAGRWNLVAGASPYAHHRAVHRREIQWSPGELHVADSFTGVGGLPVRLFLRFAPGVVLRRESERRVQVQRGGLVVSLHLQTEARVALVQGREDPPQGWCAERFGGVVPVSVVEVELGSGANREFRWSLIRDTRS